MGPQETGPRPEAARDVTAEVDVEPSAAAALLAEHCPQWAGLPLTPVVSSGMDNAMYRLGDDLVLRLPRTARSADRFARELRWLPVLARRLPVRVPHVRYAAAPSAAHPAGWSVLDWIDGQDAWTAPPPDEMLMAEDLADLVLALRAIEVPSAAEPPPPGTRGGPLAPRVPTVLAAVEAVGHLVDADLIRSIWQRAVLAPRHEGPPVLLHADLIPGNLLLDHGRLSAVIDWGAIADGDPAADLTPAWWVLGAAAREHLRHLLGADDATWQRAAGWAIAQAVLATRYYLPVGHALGDVALRALRALVSDPVIGGRPGAADSPPC